MLFYLTSILYFTFSPNETSANPVTFEAIEKVISDYGVESVSELLAHLPKSYLSSFVLLHSSDSLQDATPLAPRAIIVGPREIPFPFGPAAISKTISTDNHAILTFNGGDPALSGGDTVEIAQWRQEKQEFEYRSIRFAKGLPASISRANPPSCVRCHSLARDAPEGTLVPIWAPYFSWPKAYGSDDGMMKNGSTLDHDFREFLEIAPAHPRYKYLLNNLPQLDFGKSKYDFGPANPPLKYITYRENGYYLEPFLGDGLNTLSQTIFEAMTRLMVREIRQAPRYREYSDLIACFARYGRFQSKVDKTILDIIGENNLAFIVDARRRAVLETEELTAETSGFGLNGIRRRGHGTDISDLKFEAASDGIVWIADRLLSIPTRHWSTLDPAGSYFFESPAGELSDRLKKEFVGPHDTLSWDQCEARLKSAVTTP